MPRRRSSSGMPECPVFANVQELNPAERLAFRSFVSATKDDPTVSDDILLTQVDWDSLALRGAAFESQIRRLVRIRDGATEGELQAVIDRKIRHMQSLLRGGRAQERARGIFAKQRRIQCEVTATALYWKKHGVVCRAVEQSVSMSLRPMAPATTPPTPADPSPVNALPISLGSPESPLRHQADRGECGSRTPRIPGRRSVLDLVTSDHEVRCRCHV